MWDDYAPAEPTALAMVFGAKRRHERSLQDARARFEEDRRQYLANEEQRQQWVQAQRIRHSALLNAHEREVHAHNRRTEQMRRAIATRDRRAVQSNLESALSGTLLPPSLPHMAEVAYSDATEQAVVRFELPGIEVVPSHEAFTYVASTGSVREKKTPTAKVAQLYKSVLSQITLLYMRDLFEADRKLIQVTLNGHLRRTNPSTGKREFPCLISLEVTRDKFTELNLRQVEPIACLRHLNALVSNHPLAVEPVTPVLEFDLAKYNFTESVDVVADLDSRMDLTKLSPTEFEHFVRQLLEATGLEGWTTERSGDDGVDAVVLNRTSLVGGLTIVQAKKYTKVLGVSHVRELVGAMDEKRAGRAILVTTSWFTAGCRKKAHDNGRVELIDGARLRGLAREHLGKDVLVAPRSAEMKQTPETPPT